MILLPIGRYVGLDDYSGLMALKKQIGLQTHIIGNDVSIWDIMYTIANSSFFIGTSLHGNVTSQSFAVPHIGLSSRKSKLDFYLNTWDIEAQSTCPKPDDLFERVENVLSIPAAEHIKNRDYLIEAAKENFHRIANIILS